MADVDMKDAPAPKVKAGKAGASADTGDKKRFEVKKVSRLQELWRCSWEASILPLNYRCHSKYSGG
jgi:hypothetical protein